MYDDPILKRFIQLQNCLVGYPDLVPGVLPSLETNNIAQALVLRNKKVSRALLHNMVKLMLLMNLTYSIRVLHFTLLPVSLAAKKNLTTYSMPWDTT